ncbi:hypothetical protein EOM89_10880, partial [Candidatus Falkowbacteria bacterium]|nr:hypothetical protein [Candidatus Falkowbacteria bacterium]
LVALARRVAEAVPHHDLTLDPLEHHGFEYHTGTAFCLFGRGARGELGRGGAYETGPDGAIEPSAGATLYLDAVLDVAACPPKPRLVLVSPGLPAARRRALQAEGWTTVPALGAAVDQAEALRLGCSHILDEDGQRLGERGHEFGTVTGRKRRCGWFDAVLVRQTCAISGVNGIALTKLDVLDGFKTLKICVGYEIDGVRYDYLPTAAALQARVVPIYEEMDGWSESTQGARSWAELPAAAIKYVRRIEELIQCPVAMLSTSPERDDTILVTDPFAD